MNPGIHLSVLSSALKMEKKCFLLAVRQTRELRGAALEPGEQMKKPGGGCRGVTEARLAPQSCCIYFYNDASRLDLQTETQVGPVSSPIQVSINQPNNQ